MASKRKGDSPAEGQKKLTKKLNFSKDLVDWKMLKLPITNPTPNPRLERNLKDLRLDGLLGKPWIVKINSVVQDFYKWEESVTEGSIRGNLEAWTSEFVAKLYSLDTEGEEDWMKEEVDWEEYFDIASCDPKTGWKVEHCKNPELRDLFAFLLPILYPTKPHRITKGFATTLLWAWKFDRKVNWAAIFVKNIQKLVAALHPDKHTYLCPFIAHGYSQAQVFTPVEESDYDQAEAAWTFQLIVKQEEAEEIEEPEGSDSVSLDPSPTKTSGRHNLRSRIKKTAKKPPPASGSRVESKGKQPEATAGGRNFHESFQTVHKGLKEMLDEHQGVSNTIFQLCNALDCRPEELLEKATKGIKGKQLQEELDDLKAKRKGWMQERQSLHAKFRKL
jgi:hypothetical protein